ncbi:GNAT family N-acetyltransferase [Sulfitobacter sp. D35]|uniref:GNAT family N-acetyltransferase n=1 Tax=Sulfitobacter sp. D35 TaxID=3083252 RepID=UPI00296FEC44|nr:GNAT family N-acetyltransferase [Sulfitobacter sp. D35]MDW4500255.1 GNAT family N-acetyltransferase [Sulfitobacter sp. D35]
MSDRIVRFRRIQLAEYTDIGARLLIACYRPPPWNEEWSPKLAMQRLNELSSTPSCLSIGAFHENSLVGFAAGVPHTGAQGTSLYLSEIVVEPQFQNAGVGASLLLSFERLAKELGYESIWLVTARAESTIRFYYNRQYQEPETLLVLARTI